MSVAKSLGTLGKETLAYGIASAINRSISILLIPLYTRVFTTEEYGTIGVILPLVALLNVLVSGLDNAAGRWFFEYQEEQERQQVIASWFWFQVGVSVPLVVIALIFATPLARLLLDSPSQAILLQLAIVGMAAALFGKVVTYLYRFQQKPWLLAAFTTIRSLLMVGAIVALVVGLKWGLVGLYTAQLAVSLAVAIGVAVVYRRWLSPRRVSKKVFREMLVFGLPVIPAAFGSWLAVSSDRFVMMAFLDMSSIGVYTVALSIASAVAFLDYAFQMAWGPFAFSIMEEPHARDVYGRVLSTYVLVGCLACTGLSLFAPLILSAFTTPDYYEAASLIPYLAFSFFAIGFRDAVGIGANLAKNSRPLAIALFLGAIGAPVFTISLTPALGTDGAAIAKMLAFVIPAIYMYSASQALYRIPYQAGTMLACLAFSFVAIVFDRLFLSPTTLEGFGFKSLVLISFIPLSLATGVVRASEVGRMIEGLRTWRSRSSS